MSTALTGWILWGASGHAKVLRDAYTGAAPLVAVFDNASDLVAPFTDVPLLGGRASFDPWHRSASGMFGFLVAIGGSHGATRCELHHWLMTEGLVPLTAIHRTAFVAPTARIGPGSHVLAQSAVCVDAEIGEQCIINTGATVDHECRLGAGVHIAPGAHLAGLVDVGDHAFIGTGATILPRIRIGARAVVGAGAVVTADVADNTTVVGVPARTVERKRP